MTRSKRLLGLVITGLFVLLVALGLGCPQRELPDKPGAALLSNAAADAGPPLFEDVTEAAGVVHTYRNGEEADRYAILELVGGGAALFDFDGDGLLDLYLPGGGYFDGPEKDVIRGHPGKLYRNLGNCKFADVTAQVMPDQASFYTHGCAVADYDCDGWPDLLVTGWGRVALYHNEPADPKDPARGRRLVERSGPAGLHPVTWVSSAAWGDLDGDGYPDLYLCQYVDWSVTNNPPCPGQMPNIKRDICSPMRFNALPHHLFHNQRDGTFRDVSKEAGLRSKGMLNAAGKPLELGKALGVVMADLNGDRKPDIYIANDTTDNFLYWNRSAKPGLPRLEEMGVTSGVAVDEFGYPNGSMGVDVGDYDDSGRPSIFVTNYEGELHALYRNLGRELFTYSTSAAGLGVLGQKYVGFGTAFVDLENRGRLDLIITNGHVFRHGERGTIRQRPVLLQNKGGGKFVQETARGGPYFLAEHRGRGLALGDLDNDGRPDVVIVHQNEPVAVLRNRAGEAGPRPHWLGLELIGKQHHDLVGARVILHAGGRQQTRFIKGGGSYLSACDQRVLFGLGADAVIDHVTVEWPSGLDQSWSGLAVDRYWRLEEGVAGSR